MCEVLSSISNSGKKNHLVSCFVPVRKSSQSQSKYSGGRGGDSTVLSFILVVIP